MYIILVYDIGIERLNKVRQFLKGYLTWIQNSVFEGPLTEKQFRELKTELEKQIDTENDSIVIYKLPHDKILTKETIGATKGDVFNII